MVHSHGSTSYPPPASPALPLPDIVLPDRRALFAGAGLRVFCNRQMSTRWLDYEYTDGLIVVALDGAEAVVSWHGNKTKTNHRTIKGGEYWFVPPRVKFELEWKRHADVIIMHVSPDLMKFMGFKWGRTIAFYSTAALVLRDPLVGILVKHFSEFCEHHPVHETAQIIALGQCLSARIINGIKLSRKQPVKVKRQLGTEAMKRVFRFVDENLGEKILLASLAREARLSSNHFTVLFKATMQMTPEQYILRTRLIRAKAIIQHGAHTVGEVAHLTGFSDHSHLSVQFKKFFGAPPRAFLPTVRTT
jgi:AraC family transcriptional regulator